MQRSYRSHLFAVSASLAVCFIAPAASAQARPGDVPMYIDIVVPFTLRDLHPSVISAFPVCNIGFPPERGGKQHKWFAKSSTVIGEDRLSHLTKAEDGSYSGTLTERLEVMVPTAAAGKPGAFMCQIGVKVVGGSTVIFEHRPPGADPRMLSSSTAYRLAPNTPDRVEGQFTW